MKSKNIYYFFCLQLPRKNNYTYLCKRNRSYMNKFHLCIIIVVVVSILSSCSNDQSSINYPDTKKCDTINYYFGTQVADPFRWLEDDNSQETSTWVNLQNKCTNDYLAQIPYRQQIHDKITTLVNFPKESTPIRKGNRYFFFKNDGLQYQNVLFYKNSIDGEEIMVLDPNELSNDGTISLSKIEISKDGKYLGYAISRNGSDWNEIHVKNIETNEELDDKIEWVKFSSIAWFQDGFFYSRFSEPTNKLSSINENGKLYYHRLGTKQSEDVLVYENKENQDVNYNAEVINDRYLVVTGSISTSGNSLYIKDLARNDTDFVKIIDTYDDDFCVVDEKEGSFYILTNYKAPNCKMIKVQLSEPAVNNWQTIIASSNSGVLTDVSHLGGKFIANYTINAYSEIRIYDEDGICLYNIDNQKIATYGGFHGENSDSITFYYASSFALPFEIYRYDISTNTSTLYKRSNANIKSEDYVVEQVFFTSKDDTQIPMFIVHKKGIKLDGSNPTLLYGYGGFNISVIPSFRPLRMAWLELGGVYVLANIRGGGEFGKKWHEAGTLLNKQNVFDDFIAAAEYLIDKGYTTSKRLAIQGGSNGGLLVGAVANQRPDLFAVAVPQVGVMDMLRYHKFTIGRYWAVDYGTSEDSKEMFDYLYNYSPLHNIKDGVEYPAILVTTADHDDRVVPAHSFKYAATLQSKNIGNKPHLIRIETNAGHGRGNPTSKQIDEITDIYSFMFYNMNVEPDL